MKQLEEFVEDAGKSIGRMNDEFWQIHISREEERIREEIRMSTIRLYCWLWGNGRSEEAIKAADDMELFDRLMEEYEECS